MTKTILFLSNGHGEDLNASLILQALLKNYPKIAFISAMPLVGDGTAYHRLNIPIIGPTQTLPSGGMIYTQLSNLVKDLWSGLIKLTWRQIKAVLKYSQNCDLIIAVGDIFPITLAYLTRRPFVAFIVSTSSYYEGRLHLPFLTWWCLKSSQCQQIFTRDAFTAKDLQQQGFKQAIFLGYPVMDVLHRTETDLGLEKNYQPMIALLPGSRLPEALSNLGLLLNICEEIALIRPMQFRVALVPSITEDDLMILAQNIGWRYLEQGKLIKRTQKDDVILVRYFFNAFANILYECDLVLGMAGTAVEQAVGLGKPVVQIPGYGPQFTYRFAEAQMRLLGVSVTTIGKNPNEANLFRHAAQEVIKILHDPDYLHSCVGNGKERMGEKGGSDAIAKQIIYLL
ncbi:hypothetical protein C7H19_21330 [Aphanothece hegewaldii CCALA 016]|uniref:Lipid-A-disaccharide synthase n=1 Tax=Aphanothece hegewaldii CCALA 016 TaxID=2107694 RepID=A0A2T1LSE6_9CHRO|nr:lipid-A-disaccharide synthase-related protein [Aphanothece hegewaldii]PSF32670.1 hypothetical protein C7H19_21330 [Aphanothece hegewaldii CCALA 016]